MKGLTERRVARPRVPQRDADRHRRLPAPSSAPSSPAPSDRTGVLARRPRLSLLRFAHPARLSVVLANLYFRAHRPVVNLISDLTPTPGSILASILKRERCELGRYGPFGSPLRHSATIGRSGARHSSAERRDGFWRQAKARAGLERRPGFRPWIGVASTICRQAWRLVGLDLSGPVLLVVC